MCIHIETHTHTYIYVGDWQVYFQIEQMIREKNFSSDMNNHDADEQYWMKPFGLSEKQWFNSIFSSCLLGMISYLLPPTVREWISNGLMKSASELRTSIICERSFLPKICFLYVTKDTLWTGQWTWGRVVMPACELFFCTNREEQEKIGRLKSYSMWTWACMIFFAPIVIVNVHVIGAK